MKKPDAVTVIRPSDFRETVWKLPAGDLLYVGPSTRKKLSAVGILSIGDLANCDARILSTMLGKNGLILKLYAMGADQTPVMPVGAETAIKSIGNSVTAPRDIETFADISNVTCGKFTVYPQTLFSYLIALRRISSTSIWNSFVCDFERLLQKYDCFIEPLRLGLPYQWKQFLCEK